MDQTFSMWQLLGLGAIAGLLPIYIGIALALIILKYISRSLEGFLVGIATGVLVYLFFDLMHEAVEQTGAQDILSWIVFLGSLCLGYMGLVAIEQRQQGRHRTEPSKLFLPYMISLGMGLHNLGEGLAIGASFSQGQWVLSGLLIIGFALHNGTEGFAIIGASGKIKPAFHGYHENGASRWAPNLLRNTGKRVHRLPLPHHRLLCHGGRLPVVRDFFIGAYFLHSQSPDTIRVGSVRGHQFYVYHRNGPGHRHGNSVLNHTGE